MHKTTENELIYLNALNCISTLGPKRIGALLDCFNSPQSAWEAIPDACSEIAGLKEGFAEMIQKEKTQLEPEKEWEKLHQKQVKCLSVKCSGYPKLLLEVPYPPPIIYYRGNLENINQPAVAIVGSRRCTFYGKEVARRLAVELTEAEVSIISGMAYGVDSAAHWGVLENGGFTAAVLGCGVDRCYPPQNNGLMKEIIDKGLVISEFPIGTAPLAGNFPRRNRIISGLSLGTIVVEATAKSGALITANYAIEQNREVFAVPGNVGSPYSRGCHHLLKEGARLVESAADIMEELNLYPRQDQQMSFNIEEEYLTEDEKILLATVPYQPIHIDDLVRGSGKKASEVSSLLLSLELKQKIHQTPGKYFCRI